MTHVVSAACIVIVRLSLAVNGVADNLTIKPAGSQAQSIGIFQSFHGGLKVKAR